MVDLNVVTDPDKPDAPPVVRKRPKLQLSLSPEALARLDEMAARTGLAVSRVVDALVIAAPMPPLRPPPRYKATSGAKTRRSPKTRA